MISMEEKQVWIYQAGTAEYAEVQAARLCQLHNCLEGNKKQKQDFKTHTRQMAKKKKRMSNWEMSLAKVYLAQQQKAYWHKLRLWFPAERSHWRLEYCEICFFNAVVSLFSVLKAKCFFIKKKN